MQNAKLCLLPQTVYAMLNTTSQLLAVLHTVPKGVRVQNMERSLTFERAHLLWFTFCYARRKPYSSLSENVLVHKLHGQDLCSCCALNNPSE
jgi:hypothetical protein